MPKVGQPLGRDAVLADPHLHRIARHEADRDEGQKHQREERRDRQRDAAEKIAEHEGVRRAGPRRSRRSPSRPYLNVDAFERVRAERALLVARDVGARRFVDDRMRDQQLGRVLVLDLLHPLIELRALGLVGDRSGLDQKVVELGVAPFRDIVLGGLAVGAAEKEEEIVRIAVVAGPAHLAGHRLPSLQPLAVLAPFVGLELGVDADLGEIRLHHLADPLAVRVIRAAPPAGTRGRSRAAS